MTAVSNPNSSPPNAPTTVLLITCELRLIRAPERRLSSYTNFGELSGRKKWSSIEVLKAGNKLFRQWLAGLGPQQAAANAAVLFHGEGKSEQHLDVLLDVPLRLVVHLLPSLVHNPGSVEAEVDANVAVLLVAGLVELRAEAK